MGGSVSLRRRSIDKKHMKTFITGNRCTEAKTLVDTWTGDPVTKLARTSDYCIISNSRALNVWRVTCSSLDVVFLCGFVFCQCDDVIVCTQYLWKSPTLSTAGNNVILTTKVTIKWVSLQFFLHSKKKKTRANVSVGMIVFWYKVYIFSQCGWLPVWFSFTLSVAHLQLYPLIGRLQKTVFPTKF